MPRAKKAAPVAPESEVEATVAIVSGIDMIPLGRLVRAPENVRHTDKAVDVDSLADDIAAHGLLQNLIGYAGDTSIDKAAVYIVGGGRRLQALDVLYRRGAVDHEFPVPVLLRTAAEAIDLSLSENLAKRDMNPADEFLAFEALMRRGTVSTADLAKQFGFSERYVKQRLKLATLAPVILDALRAQEMSLEAALAYGRAADQDLQVRVFKAQAKRNYDKHAPHKIRYEIDQGNKTTDWSIYRFIGGKAYEREGGAYEEAGLFDEDNGGARKLTSAFVAVQQAHKNIDFQMVGRLKDMAEALELDPAQVVGFVKAPNLEWGQYSYAYHGLSKENPDGFAWVGNDYGSDRVERMLKVIRNNRILCQLPVGINAEGELIRIDKGFFVPLDQVRAIDPPGEVRSAVPTRTAEEIAAEQRRQQIERVRLFLAADKVNDAMKLGDVTGRRYWNSVRPLLNDTKDYDDIGAAYSVAQTLLVTPDEVAAIPFADAEAEYDRQEAEKVAHREAAERVAAEAEEAEAQERRDVLALDPLPVALRLGDLLLFRWGDGHWYDEREAEGADPVYDFDHLEEVMEWAEEEGARVKGWWATLDALDAELQGELA